jgi:hypothetical protein
MTIYWSPTMNRRRTRRGKPGWRAEKIRRREQGRYGIPDKKHCLGGAIDTKINPS